MKSKIDERKNIIVSLKPIYGERKKGIDKRIRDLMIMSSVNLILTVFCGGMIFASIISEQLGYEFYNWDKMGLLTILSLSFILSLPNDLYEIKLLNHFKKITALAEFDGIENLNTDLKRIIHKLNERLKNNWYLILLVIVIMIMGIWQMLFDHNPYWIFMKIPTMLLFGIIITRFFVMNKKLTQNITEAEKYCS